MVQPLRIGEVAREAGVNVQTLRYYERRGILPEPDRTAAGYRTYDPEAVRIVRFVKRAQDLGFTLQEIEDLLALRQNRRANCGRVKSLAEAKLGQVEENLVDLRRLKRALSGLVESCETKRASLDCPILEALEGSGARRGAARGGRRRG